MMTIERASELVNAMRIAYPMPDTKAQQLFEHFFNLMKFKTANEVVMFVEMCGYQAKVQNAQDPP